MQDPIRSVESGVMTRIDEIDRLEELLSKKPRLCNCVVQGLDLRNQGIDWSKVEVEGSIFLGCDFPSDQVAELLQSRGAALFPKFEGLPYHPYRPRLYTREELMEGWTPELDESTDLRIFAHFEKHGRHHADILESLSQRLHDHAIDDALRDLLEGETDGEGPKKVVGIMGGHGTARTDPWFRAVVLVARGLTRAGFFVASGGGPGIMEAANLGAWLAPASDEEVEKALAMLATAPVYTDPGYVEAAQRVLERHPEGAASLAVPTWFYGHEPSNLFSAHVAKYFSNSLREDGLLAIATYGVVYAPGSAGTTQEIFMDAAQNHYRTFKVVSPMIFLGKDRYERETGLYATMTRLAEGRDYADLLHLTDNPDDVVDWVVDHPPRGDSDRGDS